MKNQFIVRSPLSLTQADKKKLECFVNNMAKLPMLEKCEVLSKSTRLEDVKSL